MTKQRLEFKLVTLQDGRVLAIGDGYNTCPPMTECSGFPRPDQSSIHADLYDPVANTWRATNGLNADRSKYAAVLLRDGRVLVAGGYADSPNVCFQSAKLYDSTSETWTQTTSLMIQDRCDPASALLPDGRVLLAGGFDYRYRGLSSAEIFDPATQSWTAAASMPAMRVGSKAVTLTGGKVLVVGGFDAGYNALASAVLYDPATGLWSTAGPLSEAPNGQLVALPDGGALVVNSGEWDGGVWQSHPSERFDPITATWSQVTDMTLSRSLPFVATLTNGRVLVAGGAISVAYDATGRVTTLTPSAEIFDPVAGTWATAPDLPDVRADGATALLQDGSVLCAGGQLGEQGEAATPGGYAIQVLDSAVRYVP
jgi:hypothetical protein